MIRQLVAVEKEVMQPASCRFPLTIGQDTVLVTHWSMLIGDDVGVEVIRQLATVE